MNSPDGPFGVPTSLIPDGRPETKVRRFPLRSTIEIRPVFGAAVPLSATNKFPVLDWRIPVGIWRKAGVEVHCASACALGPSWSPFDRSLAWIRSPPTPTIATARAVIVPIVPQVIIRIFISSLPPT
jgi:hypothetical protein